MTAESMITSTTISATIHSITTTGPGIVRLGASAGAGAVGATDGATMAGTAGMARCGDGIILTIVGTLGVMAITGIMAATTVR